MNPKQILIRSGIASILLGTVFFGLSLKRIDRTPLSGHALGFNAQSAHQMMATLSKEYPYRLPWHANKKKAADWIRQSLKSWGYTPRSMMFSEVIDGKTYNDLENIYVERKGTTHPNEIILLLGHYDTTDTTAEGAMDDASGVAVVMELARIFAKERTGRTVVFLLTDSEEFGAFWGARTFAKFFDRADQIVAAASFDFVAPEEQKAILLLADGLKSGYTPLWLREIALDSMRSIGGFEVLDFKNFMEFLERALLVPPADHGALLAEGIPAFNLVGQMENFAYQMAHYHHTNADVAEAMRPESFDTYGRSAERILRTLDEMPTIPKNFRNGSYWKITDHMYLEGWGVTVLHILAFIPLLLFSLARFRNEIRRRSRRDILRVFQNEAKNVLILLGSMLVGYGLMRLLPALKLLPYYEIFPATQKSKMLYNPDFLAILLVIGTIGVVYWATKKVFQAKSDTEGNTELRHAFHGVSIAFIIFLALIGNSYLAVLLLMPPAYLWHFIRTDQNPRKRRILNILLLLGGTITFMALAVVMSTVFHIGIVYWYVFLSVTYGLFSVYTVLLFLMVMSVMIRLLRQILR